MCHVNLYVCLLVDHDLWSTLYALYVIVIICTIVIWLTIIYGLPSMTLFCVATFNFFIITRMYVAGRP